MSPGLRRRAAPKGSLPHHVTKKNQSLKSNFQWRLIPFLLTGIVVGVLIMSAIDRRWKASEVYTPFSIIEEDSLKDMSRFWGSYRPQVYMGMKTRSTHSLVTGLMWLKQNVQYQQDLPIRHTCEQGDGLLRYGWLAHDGMSFGIQEIVERGFVLRTSFVKLPGGKHGGDWSWRINAIPNGNDKLTLSLFFYAATDRQGILMEETETTADGIKLTAIKGETEELGKFTIKFPQQNSGKKPSYHFARTRAAGLHKIKESMMSKMQLKKEGKRPNEKFLYYIKNTDNSNNNQPTKSNVLFHQVTFELPFEVDMVFESGSKLNRIRALSGSTFTDRLTQLHSNFDSRFQATFPLSGYSKDHVKFAKAALSNMIGGIGHFYGQSLVQSEYQSEPVTYWSSHLITAVPSRSFFPRGFLWDEGFHELLISKWDRGLSEEVISSWLNLVNIEGWIPREQILGEEARSKVPAEFVVQRNKNANPPTLFLSIESIIQNFDQGSVNDDDKKFLEKIYPRLKAWFNWFNTTQAGELPFSYRWRGREEDSDRELNPKTLTSGLDDYPRASHPSKEERHVDLRCWMALASGTMAKIAKVLYTDTNEAEKYEQTHRWLTDLNLLKKLHWSSEMGLFSDYGNHTDRVFLTKKNFQSAQGQRPYTKTVRVTKQSPKLQFVNSYGYVSLFPFLLQILPADSHELGQVLQDLKGSDLLWSKYGLRSLSKRDPLYMKRNTEHDPPYWRGQIWININFLAVRALKHYSTTEGPHSELSSELYSALRQILVENMFKEYSKSGYLWENYNDHTGKGQGSHPFTGWSALIVLIMSEQY